MIVLAVLLEVLIGNGYVSASDTSWCFNHTTMEAWSEPGKTCHEKTADRVTGWKAEATCTKGTVQVPCKPPGSR